MLFFLHLAHSAPSFVIAEDTSTVFDDEQNNLHFQVDTIYSPTLDYHPESVLPRSFINFVGFEGQGLIYIKASNIESFAISINGQPIETVKIRKMKSAKIDVSKLVKNGRNILAVGRIKYVGDEESQTYIKIRIPYPTLINGSLGKFNMHGINVLEEFIKEEVKKGFPGCQLFVAKDGKILKNASYGYLSTTDAKGYALPFRRRTLSTPNTLYDIASNTKIYALNFAVQKLVYEKKLNLDDRVVDFFPSFIDSKKARIKGKKEVRVKDLLLHQGGLPAGYPFLKDNKLKEKDEGLTNRDATLQILMDLPLSYKRGTDSVYSDVDYMLLCFIVEKVAGLPLDEYLKKEVYEPLGLKFITFKPLQNGFKKEDCAATETHLAIRSVYKEEFSKKDVGLLQGIVHDGNAYLPMNQVSGHAGLFSNAESIGVLAQVILNGGGYGNVRIFDENIVDMFASNTGLYQTQALGWRRQGAAYSYSWAFSRLADRDAIGHTGWTGALTLIDRRENLIVVLLTNAKNTPAIAKEENRGKYEGDFYLLKNYSVVPNFVYATINNFSNQTIDNMLIELFEGRCDLHKKDSYYQNEGFINDLSAIASTIKKLSRSSSTLKEYYRSADYKQIISYIDGVRENK